MRNPRPVDAVANPDIMKTIGSCFLTLQLFNSLLTKELIIAVIGTQDTTVSVHSIPYRRWLGLDPVCRKRSSTMREFHSL